MLSHAFHSESICEENVDGRSLIVKKYRNNEGLNEIRVYKDILQRDTALLAPAYYSSSDKDNMLKISKYDLIDEITTKVIDEVQDWMIYKYNKYKKIKISVMSG